MGLSAVVLLLGLAVILVLSSGFCVLKVKVLVLVAIEVVVTLLGRDVAEVGAIEVVPPVWFEVVVLLSELVL